MGAHVLSRTQTFLTGEASMSSNPDRGTKWADMNFSTKIRWTLKLVVALATFGFVYPNVMHE
jgi:hypothetical protein